MKIKIEYKGKKTLQQYLYNKSLTIKQTYSIILQICKILWIAYNGGYSHNDLHNGNIMINSTELKNFTFLNNKISFNGLHITAIDYDSVSHKKFKINNNYIKSILKNRKQHLFNEIFASIMYIIINFDKYIYNCLKNKQKLPWERKTYQCNNIYKIIIKNHNEFYIAAKNKYTLIFSNSIELINYVEENLDNFDKKIKDNDKLILINQVIERIINEFIIYHPKLYKEYFRWCSYHQPNIPKEDILDIMIITNVDDLFNYLISKI